MTGSRKTINPKQWTGKIIILALMVSISLLVAMSGNAKISNVPLNIDNTLNANLFTLNNGDTIIFDHLMLNGYPILQDLAGENTSITPTVASTQNDQNINSNTPHNIPSAAPSITNDQGSSQSISDNNNAATGTACNENQNAVKANASDGSYKMLDHLNPEFVKYQEDTANGTTYGGSIPAPIDIGAMNKGKEVQSSCSKNNSTGVIIGGTGYVPVPNDPIALTKGEQISDSDNYKPNSCSKNAVGVLVPFPNDPSVKNKGEQVNFSIT